jgi:hypothetical protein
MARRDAGKRARTQRHAAAYSSGVLPVDRKVGIERLVTAYSPQPVCGNEPSGVVEPTGAKMTATWQLRTLPPPYIVCALIETS